MQVIISHRGNLNGPNPVEENNPTKVMGVIAQGFDVEVDLWYLPEGIFLGHDAPKYKVDYWFLINKHLWIHCKNVKAIACLSEDERLNLFYHTEGATYTSKGYLITEPGKSVGYKSIACMPELVKDWDIREAYGVCTDYPLKYR
ncbi:MAG: hypothetical protein ABSA76_02255 [Bacteroidales bacterium]|jgi:hypothetical protein